MEPRKVKSLNQILTGIKKKYGEAIVEEPLEVGVVPTGFSNFDAAVGIGGIPIGRIVELYSPEGCGKTTFGIHCAVAFQKIKKKVVWVDFEQCFTREYAKTIGLLVDLPDFILLRPECAEKGFDSILRLMEAPDVGLVVVDSIAAAVPKQEFEGLGLKATQPGLQSRVVTGFIKELNPLLSSAQTSIIFINQLRSAISFGYGAGQPTQTTPGGKALKFYATLRVYLQMGKKVKLKGSLGAAHIIHFAIAKNKLAIPYSKTDLLLTHGKGFSDIEVASEEALEEDGEVDSFAVDFEEES